MVIRSGVAGLTAHTMFFNDEIRRQEYCADRGSQSAELDLAKRLIEVGRRRAGEFRAYLSRALTADDRSQVAGRGRREKGRSRKPRPSSNL